MRSMKAPANPAMISFAFAWESGLPFSSQCFSYALAAWTRGDQNEVLRRLQEKEAYLVGRGGGNKLVRKLGLVGGGGDLDGKGVWISR